MSEVSVLIIGGAGFIGSKLSQELKKNYSVTILSRKPVSMEGVRTIVGDYSQQDTHSLLTGFDVVIHLAWSSTPTMGLAYSQEKAANILPSQALIEAAKKSGVGHFIFLSSAGAVAGEIGATLEDESLAKPHSSYGKAKFEVERFLEKSVTKNFRATVLRVSNVLDSGQTFKRKQGLVPALLLAAKKKDVFTLYGDAEKDYVLLDDLVKVFPLILNNPVSFKRYVVGSGFAYKTSQIVDKLCQKLDLSIKIVKKPALTTDSKKVIINPSGLINLGWHPKDPLKEIVDELYTTYQKAN